MRMFLLLIALVISGVGLINAQNEFNGHEYVDLGLPSGLLWATCNIGADTPEAYGDYYACGETEPAPNNSYSSSNCSTEGEQINDISGNTFFDAASVNWGSNWRIPTNAEMKELIDNCTWTWTKQNGVNGYMVVSKINDNSIFLPAAGYRSAASLFNDGSKGYYWSSTPNYSNTDQALNLSLQDYMYCMYPYYYRHYGFTIRPVNGGDFEGSAAQYASVTTSTVSEVASTTAICGGNVTTDNGTTVTAKGVCWSTSSNPTIDDNKTIDGSGVGTFTSNLTNLAS